MRDNKSDETVKTVAHLFDFREIRSSLGSAPAGAGHLALGTTAWPGLVRLGAWQLDALHLNLFKIQLLAKTSQTHTHTHTEEV